MLPDEIKHEVGKLSPAERLKLLEDLWDDLIADSNVPVPEWHAGELDRRVMEYKAGQSSLADAQEVHDRLREEYR